MRARPPDPSTYAGLVVNVGTPANQRRLDQPRRARVRARVYGGDVVDLELDVVSRAPGHVCVRQERDGQAPWLAWVPADQATPL